MAIIKSKEQKIKFTLIKGYDGSVITEITEIMNRWRSAFSSLYNVDIDRYENGPDYIALLNMKNNLEAQQNLPGYKYNTFLNGELSFDEIEKAVKQLKKNKATGCYNIQNEFLMKSEFLVPLYRLFQTIFNAGLVPTIWGKCCITPIPKSSMKDPFTPLNYRGISLLSCVSKLYSRVIKNRLTDYCNICDILVDEQNGFRKDHSCLDHISSLSSIIKNRLLNNKPTFTFIYMSKAFWVIRDLLFLRLLQYGVDGKFYRTIKTVYRNNVSCVKINNCNTEWFEISSGVRRGDTLSPSLFLLFIKELNIGIDINGKTVCTLFYADDIVLFAENEEDLQRLIAHVHKWCNKWKMFINSDNNKVVHFRNSRKPVTLFKFSNGDTDLEIVKTYNYF